MPGILTRFAFETYERELERYGGEAGMQHAEELFFRDSRTVTELLQLEAGRLPGLDRITVGCLSVETYSTASASTRRPDSNSTARVSSPGTTSPRIPLPQAATPLAPRRPEDAPVLPSGAELRTNCGACWRTIEPP